MIDWRDVSDVHGERHTCELGAVDVDVCRPSPRARDDGRWLVTIRWRLARSHDHRTAWLDASCDVERARALALQIAKPLVDALAERATMIAREVATAVANARLDGVA